MIDHLRLLWNRPLTDRDRRHLFAAAVAIIAAAAATLALTDQPNTDRPSATRHAPTPTAPALTLIAPPPPAATATPAAPSEEGQPTATGTPTDITASRRTARAFLAGYLPYTYARQSARQITHASPELRRRLIADRPRVPATEHRLRPRVVLLQTDGVSHDRAQLHALVDDAQRSYTVALELARTRAGWTVTRAGS